jgi:hypothetical protein
MTLRRFRSGAGWITLAPLLLASPIGCQRARDPGASSLAKVPGSRPGQRCGDGQVACGVLCCRLNERCIDDRCYCTGMICGDECRPKPLSCAVVIRSQQRDHCNATAAGIGCGPRKPAPELDVCDIGVVHRELVDSIGDCDEARFLVVTAAACRAYRQKNAGGPSTSSTPIRTSGSPATWTDSTRGAASGKANCCQARTAAPLSRQPPKKTARGDGGFRGVSEEAIGVPRPDGPS